MKLSENSIFIGTGALSWDRAERITNRYGTITLNNTNSMDEIICLNADLKVSVIEVHEKQKGKLIAEILEVRKSTHIGDIFRNIYPSTPKKGELIILGQEGALFIQKSSNSVGVGLYPNDNRKSNWLDPNALYKCHEQTVNLYFVPELIK